MTKYQEYQLRWMLDHGHSLEELVSELQKMQYSDPEDSDRISTPISELFAEWEQDAGFGGEIYACEAEWLDCEADIQNFGDSVEAEIENLKLRRTELEAILENWDDTAYEGDKCDYEAELDWISEFLDSLDNEYIVSMAVDGRVDIPVIADNFDEAFRKAEREFATCDLSKMEVVGCKPVNAERRDGEFRDYNG